MAQHNNHELGGARLDLESNSPIHEDMPKDAYTREDRPRTPYEQGRDLVVTIEQGVLDNFYKRYMDRIDDEFKKWTRSGCNPESFWQISGQLFDDILREGTDYEVFMMWNTPRHRFQLHVWQIYQDKLKEINPEHNNIPEIGRNLDSIVLQALLATTSDQYATAA